MASLVSLIRLWRSSSLLLQLPGLLSPAVVGSVVRVSLSAVVASIACDPMATVSLVFAIADTPIDLVNVVPVVPSTGSKLDCPDDGLFFSLLRLPSSVCVRTLLAGALARSASCLDVLFRC